MPALGATAFPPNTQSRQAVAPQLSKVAHAPNLNPDILLTILASYEDDPPKPKSNSSRTGAKTNCPHCKRTRFVQLCAAICQQWRAVILHLLYQEICIHLEIHLSNLVSALNHSQRLTIGLDEPRSSYGRWTQSVDCTFPIERLAYTGVLQQLLRHCSNLQKLTYQSARPAGLPGDIKLLSTLSSVAASCTELCLGERGIFTASTIVGRLHRLQNLRITISQTYPCKPFPPVVLPELTEFYLHVNCGSQPSTSVHTLARLWNMPRLRTMTIAFDLRHDFHDCDIYPRFSDGERAQRAVWRSIESELTAVVEAFGSQLEALSILESNLEFSQVRFRPKDILTACPALTHLRVPADLCILRLKGEQGVRQTIHPNLKILHLEPPSGTIAGYHLEVHRQMKEWSRFINLPKLEIFRIQDQEFLFALKHRRGCHCFHALKEEDRREILATASRYTDSGVQIQNLRGSPFDILNLLSNPIRIN